MQKMCSLVASAEVDTLGRNLQEDLIDAEFSHSKFTWIHRLPDSEFTGWIGEKLKELKSDGKNIANRLRRVYGPAPGFRFKSKIVKKHQGEQKSKPSLMRRLSKREKRDLPPKRGDKDIIPCFWYTNATEPEDQIPSTERKSVVALVFHGGGYVCGSSHEAVSTTAFIGHKFELMYICRMVQQTFASFC